MATLLEDWRDNLRWPPASALVSREEAVEALRTGLADRRRGRRGLATIGSVAAALLVMSGFGAMVVEARPGTTLYGLHAMFFDQPRVNEKNQVMLSAKADLAKVQESIDRGQWDQARNQLTEVSSSVQSIDDPASKQELTNQLKLLNVRVQSRNPNATLPPPANTPSSVVHPDHRGPDGGHHAFRGFSEPVSYAVTESVVEQAPASRPDFRPVGGDAEHSLAGVSTAQRRYPSASEVASLSEASAYPRQ